MLGKILEFLRAMPTQKYDFVVCNLAFLGQNPGGPLGLERVGSF